MIFDDVLRQFTQEHNDVIGIIFCDHEGEMVCRHLQSAEILEDYDLRLTGATANIWHQNISRIHSTASEKISFYIKMKNYAYAIHGLPDGYSLTAITKPDCTLSQILFDLQFAAQKIAADM